MRDPFNDKFSGPEQPPQVRDALELRRAAVRARSDVPGDAPPRPRRDHRAEADARARSQG